MRSPGRSPARGSRCSRVATFDTDVVLVREETLARAVEALRAAGHQVEDEG